ncbi:cytochrome P450 [Nakamurella sp.]|uniref:cytochrome P450 n=1 Tax=Nakamurella sp. TaxID=1869182 RepID=UPI0037845FD3
MSRPHLYPGVPPQSAEQFDPAPGSTVPSPAGARLSGHLPRWGRDAIALLEEGARLGPVFRVRLWRSALVGYRPEWNRMILSDLETFRSRGSMSQLSPFLRGGVIALEAPGHRRRRSRLNPAFHRRAVTPLFSGRFDGVVDRWLPTGVFDAVSWAAAIVRRMLADAFFGPGDPPVDLGRFLAPLDRALPAPLLPRPVRIGRMTAVLKDAMADPPPATLIEAFAGLPGPVAAEEARVALAAGYDTTAHTLAFTLWEVAGRSDLNDVDRTEVAVREALRLYPAGWIGSRVATRPVEIDSRFIRAGQLVLYSPYLTHRDPQMWLQPNEFRPERFDQPLPAWGYLPFGAGERSCLGAALAIAMVEAATRAFARGTLRRVAGDPRPAGVLTLTPRGPLILEHRPRS